MTNAQMAWPVCSSVAPTTAASATPGVSDEGGFDLGGGDAVSGDVHDVVDAAQDPDFAVGAVAGAVTGEVPALLAEAGPVGLGEALRVTPDAAQHPRPGLVQDQVAAGLFTVVGAGVELVAVVVDDHRRDAR